jgi:methylthioribose-1-phosphate isomerase
VGEQGQPGQDAALPRPGRGSVRAVRLGEGEVVFLDQTKLPGKIEFLAARSVEEVARAIETMVVRGAPAIGIAAAFGLALHAELATGQAVAGPGTASPTLLTPQAFLVGFDAAAERLTRTRPTAVNLFWAIDRMKRVAREAVAPDGPHVPGWPAAVRDRLRAEALEIAAADERANREMGRFGQELLPGKCRILTHCNAGALATGGYGTALGIIRAAVEAGKDVSVLVDETRPLWQGARLTAWEMLQEGIPATLITDNMAGWFMSLGQVDAVIVGADRIAANGDTANKIGTYSVAVLAAAHGIPFYVAAPRSTIDVRTSNGREIIIEQRAAEEVSRPYGLEVAPSGVVVANPAFDVTPARLIAAIVTEAGVARPPFDLSLAGLLARL